MHGGDTIRTDAPAAVGGMVGRGTLMAGVAPTEEVYADSDIDVSRLWRANAAFLRGVFHTRRGTTWLVDVLQMGMVEVAGTVHPDTFAQVTGDALIPDNLDVLQEVEGRHLVCRTGASVALQPDEGTGFLRAASDPEPPDADVIAVDFFIVSEAQRFAECAKMIFGASPLHAPLVCLPFPHPALCRLTLYGAFREAPLRAPVRVLPSPGCSPPDPFSSCRLTVSGEAEAKVSREAHVPLRLWVGNLDLNFSIFPARTDLSRWLPKGLDLYVVGFVGISEEHYPDKSRLVHQILRHVGKKTHTLVAVRSGDGVEACLFALAKHSLLARLTSPESEVVTHRRTAAEVAAAADASRSQLPTVVPGTLTERLLQSHQQALKQGLEGGGDVAPASDAAPSERTPSDGDVRRYTQELAKDVVDVADTIVDSTRAGEEQSQLDSPASQTSTAVALRMRIEETDFCFVLVRVRLAAGDFGQQAVQLRSRLIKELLCKVSLGVPGGSTTLQQDVASLHDQTYVFGSLGEEILLEVRAGNVMDDFSEGDLVLPQGGSLSQRVFHRSMPGAPATALGYEAHVPWGTVQEGRHAVAAVFEAPLLLTFNEAFSTPSALHSFEITRMEVQQMEEGVHRPHPAEGGPRAVCVSAPFGASVDDMARSCSELSDSDDPVVVFSHTNSQAFLEHKHLRFGVEGVGVAVLPVKDVFDAAWCLRMKDDSDEAPGSLPDPSKATELVTRSAPLPFHATLRCGGAAARAPSPSSSSAPLVLAVTLRLVTDATPLVHAAREKLERDEAARQALLAECLSGRAPLEAEQEQRWHHLSEFGTVQHTEQLARTHLACLEAALFAEAALRSALIVSEAAPRAGLQDHADCLAALSTLSGRHTAQLLLDQQGSHARLLEEEAAASALLWASLAEGAAGVSQHESRLDTLDAGEVSGRAGVEAAQAQGRGWIVSHAAFAFTESAERDELRDACCLRLAQLCLEEAEGRARRTLAASERGSLWADVLHPALDAERGLICASSLLALRALCAGWAAVARQQLSEQRQILDYLARDAADAGERAARRLLEEEEALPRGFLGTACAVGAAEHAARDALLHVTFPAMLASHFEDAAAGIAAAEADERAAISEAHAAGELPSRVALCIAELDRRAAIEHDCDAAYPALRGAFAEDAVSAGDRARVRQDSESLNRRAIEDGHHAAAAQLLRDEAEAIAGIEAMWHQSLDWVRRELAAMFDSSARRLTMSESFQREELLVAERSWSSFHTASFAECTLEVSQRGGIEAEWLACALSWQGGAEGLSRWCTEDALLRWVSAASQWCRGTAQVEALHTLHHVDAMDLVMIEAVARQNICFEEGEAWGVQEASHSRAVQACASFAWAAATEVCSPEEEGRRTLEALEAAKWEDLIESTVMPEWLCGDEGSSPFLATLRAARPSLESVVKLKTGRGQYHEHFAVLRGSYLSVYEEKRRLDLSFGCTTGSVPFSESGFTVACPGFVGAKALVMQARTKAERDLWTATLLGHRQSTCHALSQTDDPEPEAPPEIDLRLRDAVLDEADQRYSAVVSHVMQQLEQDYTTTEHSLAQLEQRVLDASAGPTSPSSPLRLASKRRVSAAPAPAAPAVCRSQGAQTDVDAGYIDDIQQIAEQALGELAALRAAGSVSPAGSRPCSDANVLPAAHSKSEGPGSYVRRPREVQGLVRAVSLSPSHSSASHASPSPRRGAKSIPHPASLHAEGAAVRSPYALSSLPLDLRLRSVSASPVALDEIPSPRGASLRPPPPLSAVYYASPRRPAREQCASPAQRRVACSVERRQGPAAARGESEVRLMAQSLQAARDEYLGVLKKLEGLASDVMKAVDSHEQRGVWLQLEQAVVSALDGVEVSITRKGDDDDSSQELFSIADPHSPRAARSSMAGRILKLEERLRQYESCPVEGAFGISADDVADAMSSYEVQIEGLTALCEQQRAQLEAKGDDLRALQEDLRHIRQEAAHLRQAGQGRDDRSTIASLEARLAHTTRERDELAEIADELAAHASQHAEGPKTPPTEPAPAGGVSGRVPATPVSAAQEALVSEALQRGTHRLAEALDAHHAAHLSALGMMQAQRVGRTALADDVVRRERSLRAALHQEEGACLALLRRWADSDRTLLHRRTHTALREMLTALPGSQRQGASPSGFCPGAVVRACNVVATAYLNNKYGTVSGCIGAGSQERFLVSFPPPYGDWALRRENLRLVPPQQVARLLPPLDTLVLREQSSRHCETMRENLQRLALLTAYLVSSPSLVQELLPGALENVKQCCLEVVSLSGDQSRIVS